MKISIGSKNAVKVDAVKEVIMAYDFLRESEIISLDVPSLVQDQPKSMQETIEGARNRAKNAFTNCDLSFGIESGFMQVPYAKTGWMEFTACVIYDGKEYHMGLSPAFECPAEVMKLIQEGKGMSVAFYEAGLYPTPHIGKEGGGLGVLTKGRMDRKGYTKHAIVCALIHLDNAHLYKKS